MKAIHETFELKNSQVEINPKSKGENKHERRGVALDQDQVSIRHDRKKTGKADKICSMLANSCRSRDSIVQMGSCNIESSKYISSVLCKHDKNRADHAIAQIQYQWPGAASVIGKTNTRISDIKARMQCKHETSGRMFKVFAKRKINIKLKATNETNTRRAVANKDEKEKLGAESECLKLDQRIKNHENNKRGKLNNKNSRKSLENNTKQTQERSN